jgi:hypothetical protein
MVVDDDPAMESAPLVLSHLYLRIQFLQLGTQRSSNHLFHVENLGMPVVVAEDYGMQREDKP